LLGCLALIASGCQKSEEIERYRALKAEVVAEVNKHEKSARREPAPPVPTQFLAAIVPQASELWFFKLAGPPDKVTDQAVNFLSFIRSLKFGESEGAMPEWRVPEGWVEGPGNPMRRATFKIPAGDEQLDMSISTLPRSKDLDDDILQNVNRWRGQLNLPKLAPEEIATHTKQIELGETTVTFVNISGMMKPNTMGQPPFARGGR